MRGVIILTDTFLNESNITKSMAIRAWVTGVLDPLSQLVIQEMIEENGGLSEGWVVSKPILDEGSLQNSAKLPTIINSNESLDDYYSTQGSFHQGKPYSLRAYSEKTYDNPANNRRKQSISANEFISRLNSEYIHNMKWVLEHPEKLSRYSGSWVVIAKNKIYYNGSTCKEVVERALKEGLEKGTFLVEYIDYPDRTY